MIFFWAELTGSKVFSWALLEQDLKSFFSFSFFCGLDMVLVGGLEHDFYFSIYRQCHHPTWLLYFSEGLKLNHQPAIIFPWYSHSISSLGWKPPDLLEYGEITTNQLESYMGYEWYMNGIWMVYQWYINGNHISMVIWWKSSILFASETAGNIQEINRQLEQLSKFLASLDKHRAAVKEQARHGTFLVSHGQYDVDHDCNMWKSMDNQWIFMDIRGYEWIWLDTSWWIHSSLWYETSPRNHWFTGDDTTYCCMFLVVPHGSSAVASNWQIHRHSSGWRGPRWKILMWKVWTWHYPLVIQPQNSQNHRKIVV